MTTVSEVDAADGYRFRWKTDAGQFELQWLPERERWIRSFRASDPSGQGGWPEPQFVELETPNDYDDAKRIATDHAKETP